MRIKARGARIWQAGRERACTSLRGFAMTRLMMTLFSMIATTLMGVAIVASLTAGYDTLQPILIAAAIGFVLAIPASYLVAKRLS
jgi:predicted PurR-regulated permease PerM